MRVVYDGIAFENPHQRGIQRYFRELIDHLPVDVDVDLMLAAPPRAAMSERARLARVDPFLMRLLPRGLRRRAAPAMTRRARSRLEMQAGLLHSTYFTRAVSGVPCIVSVQDMIVERFPDYYPTRWADDEIRRKRAAILAATVLLTGTHAAAAELRAFYPGIADRIRTVHYGSDHIPEASSESAPPGVRESPHALFVGDRALYKNFRCILEAMAEPGWPRGLILNVVGPEPRENELALAERMARGRVRFLGRVEDAALSALYRSAAATIVPSLEEGFGFPVLEAQRAGSAVVCSQIPVFRELAAEAAVYFDPHRPDLLAEAVARTIDFAERERLRDAGLANARRFTWSGCAEQTVALYRELVGKNAAP